MRSTRHSPDVAPRCSAMLAGWQSPLGRCEGHWDIGGRLSATPHSTLRPHIPSPLPVRNGLPGAGLQTATRA